MSPEWETRRDWAGQFEDAVLAEIGRAYAKSLKRASYLLDVQQATDFVNKSVSEGHGYGIRVRAAEYYRNEKYRFDFTLRGAYEGCPESEFQKILNGCGRWYSYGFGNAEQGEILSPGTAKLLGNTIIDLDAFREAYQAGALRFDFIEPYYQEPFYAFDLRYFRRVPRPVIIETTLAIPDLESSDEILDRIIEKYKPPPPEDRGGRLF